MQAIPSEVSQTRLNDDETEELQLAYNFSLWLLYG